jgi:hypothetical protein
VVAWPERSDLIGQDWSDSPHFRYLKENPGAVGFTEIQPIGPQGMDAMLCSSVSPLSNIT